MAQSRKFAELTIIILVGLSIILVGLLCAEILFGPLTLLRRWQSLPQIQVELALAKERWKSHQITSYQVDVQGFVRLACVYNATLTVRKGSLVEVVTYNSGLGQPNNRANPPKKLPESEWKNSWCSYHDLLIPAMFDQVEKELPQIKPSTTELTVTFDPQFGFINNYEHKDLPIGLLDPIVSGCCFGYQYSNFRPITSTTTVK